jgi:hypothetical protein
VFQHPAYRFSGCPVSVQLAIDTGCCMAFPGRTIPLLLVSYSVHVNFKIN